MMKRKHKMISILHFYLKNAFFRKKTEKKKNEDRAGYRKVTRHEKVQKC